MQPLTLVTGGAGYIGSVLVRQLLEAGHRVRVVDILRQGGESLLGVLDDDAFELVRADVRDADAMRAALEGCSAVVHLAAVVGDPACKREPELAREVNDVASKQLFELAEQAGVGRFVFASTCSNYGRMEDPSSFVTEDSPLRPVSLYAETKVEVEKYLLGSDRDRTCAPTSLRFSTVYGLSPRPRFDLTVNEFTRELVLGKELVVFGEQFWRPYCHVRDLARSVVAVLQADLDDVAFQVFNVGDTDENYQKATLVEFLEQHVPGARVRYVEVNEDPRDYRVSFQRIRDVLGFRITRTVPDGIHEIKKALEDGLFLDPYDDRYSNIAKAPPAPAGGGTEGVGPVRGS